MRTLVCAALAAAIAGCGPPPRSEPDPWDDDWASDAARGGGGGETGNIRVDVSVFEIDERDAEGWRLFWGASIPLGDHGHLSVNGLRSATGGAAFFANLDAWQRRSTVKRRTSPFLVVADGYPASLEVSEVQREPVTVIYYEAGVAVRTWDWTRAGCSLEVTPRKLGDGRYEVRVRPVVAHREGAGRTRIGELDTVAVVPEGEAVVLGGSDEVQQSVGGTFFGRWSAGRRYRIVFVMRVRGV